MKISSFQIKNYRSIVDSGKCLLSPDYITALIGQNESGKTSVLEALRSFYEGYITDDVLRSDLTFPEIICEFTLDEGKELSNYIDINRLPQELRPVISNKKEVSVQRIWLNSRTNFVSIAEKEILDFYKQLELLKEDSSNKIISSVPDLTKHYEAAIQEIDAAENDVAYARTEINAVHNRCEELKRALNKAKSPDIKITTERDLNNASELLSQAETNLKEKLTRLEEKKIQIQTLTEKLNICKLFSELTENLQSLKSEIKEKSLLLSEVEHQFEQARGDKEKRILIRRLEELRESHSMQKSAFNERSNYLSRIRSAADKVLNGKRLKDAEQEALRENEIESNYASAEELGASVFKHIPMFEFFEDFSSLLPNKIDLDDLLNENIHAEGYKAARNFLYVAGLNADFFREKNHRILKQKIENLNSEITIDFQDYWRQSVGKDDKIRINFELEHYDNSQSENSGKPYLEFWVKDKQERLYPKQRSRGVRWFLSFYLELKATAKANSVDRVMLIDEPGLSLHARAQEDVLKVFEDLRSNLQIIYCTHSPNLIDLKKLYRIIAVQRAKESDEKSETIVLDARSLNEASSDTLSPIYALMGTRLNDRQFIFPKNNLIVEDAVTFHYIEAVSKLAGYDGLSHFIPASGADHITDMVNILFGWKIDFGVLLMDNTINNQIVETMRLTTFFPDQKESTEKFIMCQGFPIIEDLFSTIDFKRFILKQRVGITVKNSEYIQINNLSRIILVSDFCSRILRESISFKDFDDETRGNFEKLFLLIRDRANKE